MKKFLALTTAVLTAAALLTGCGPDSENYNEDITDTEPSNEDIPEADVDTESSNEDIPENEVSNSGVEFPFEAITLEYCSGAGAWATDMNLYGNGDFSGAYHDSEMGEADESSYPDGSIYVCTFYGTFNVSEASDNTYTLDVIDFNSDYIEGSESIEDGIRYVSSTAYGIDGVDSFTFCMPTTTVGELQSIMSEDLLDWVNYSYMIPVLDTTEESEIGAYLLFSNDAGVVYAGYVDEGYIE